MIEKVKSHDQRKGQWLFNNLRCGEFSKETEEGIFVARLYAMSNKEFDELMDKYDK